MKTRQLFAGLCQGFALSMAFLPVLWSASATANLSGATMATYAAAPIEIVQNVPPLVMLTMSMDHQYWQEAYNDFTDLTGDGDVERTYDDTFNYYGYFHSKRCYQYVDADFRFNPVGVAAGTNGHYCDGGLDNAWSGNFLNWASMTRMDIVRKILYGGYRSTDTATTSVLERAHLPTDAHAFAKYYNGADINSLVPSSYGALKVDRANGGNNNGIDDGDEGITICNVSFKATGSSQGTTGTTPVETPNPAPMLRVVRKNYQLWTANEVRQCTWQNELGANPNGNNAAASGINAALTDPPDSDALRTPSGLRDHIARVKVCDPAFFDANQDLENCKAYGANLKPEGLLQLYGLDGQVKFGLITGSYAKNLSGGVLRKNVGPLTDEVNVSDGTFIAKTGTQTGIIRTLNAVRIYGYDYAAGNYLGASGDNCGFQQTTFTEGTCKSWGNPMSEIYLESLRYFAISSGRAPTPTFTANVSPNVDSNSIAGLVEDNWTTDPLTSDNFCASLNTIVFNASVSSYDDNETTNTLFGDAKALTKTVGDGEGITGKDFFIGSTPGNNNEFCSSKKIASLGDAFGLCPEAPTLRGSFHMAGLAHYAHITDLRTSSAFEGKQSVNTFAVSLATSTPVIEAFLGDAGPTTPRVRILPAYRLRAGGNNASEALNNPANDGAGSMVDFKIITPHTMVTSAVSTTPAVVGSNTGHYYGKFWMNWEDSEQGGDFDQDSWGIYEYRVNTNVSPATIQVTTNLVSGIGGGFPQLFGFVISGTTQDGFHAYSGTRAGQTVGANFTDPTGVKGCVDCQAVGPTAPGATSQKGPQSFTFTASAGGAAGLLESPLYYAAKWGGFEDEDKNNQPNLQAEWDVKNTSGQFVTGGDGIPDNFFFVTNPSALEDALSTIFNTILERVSSGTSAAVVANDRIGNGALFQAVYDPFKKDTTPAANEAKWIGTLHGLWVDDAGFIREDSGVKGKLESYKIDQVVELFFDKAAGRSKLRRFESTQDATFVKKTIDDPGTVDELKNLRTIWNARNALADLPESGITTQRAYGALADTGRHILTWIDGDADGVVDSGETIDFTSTAITSSNFVWLDTDTEAAADRLVNWTRGLQTGMTEFRSRLLDYAGDGSTVTPNGNPEVMRLGDIVHSTPISVSAPREAIDIVFGDDSYRLFRNQYVNRRQVVYVGANDGMIHAFNAGFFDVASKTFALKGKPTDTAHPLGTELWAYVPKNLLPHLQWTARKDYSHVYYVDNAARVFDVKIFADDGPTGLHPGGWGTILVATMAFGGGSDETGITVDTARDGVAGDATPADNVKTKSAVVIVDITDPEKPPVVLAELTPPNLQFTTSEPQAVVINDTKAGGTTNKWFLVMGSGASNLASASYQSGSAPERYADLFVYDLSKLSDTTLGKVAGLVATKSLAGDTKNKDVYIGDITGVDYDFNYKSDTIYFGTVGRVSDDPAVNQGSVFRVSMNEKANPADWSAPFTLISDINQPFAKAPTLQLDDRLRHWVMAASGRFEIGDDRATFSKQTLYGVVDSLPNVSSVITSPLKAGSLVDVTNARVFSNGISIDDNTSTEFTQKTLRAAVLAAGGWKRDFASDKTDPKTDPSQRGVSGMTAIGGIILVPAFTPDTKLCTAQGASTLLGLSFLTGTASAQGVFGDIPCSVCNQGVTEMPPTPMGKNEAGIYKAVTYDGKLEKSSVTRNASSLSERGAAGSGGSQPTPTGGRACATTSTAAIACTAIDFEDQIFNGEISWRELRNAE